MKKVLILSVVVLSVLVAGFAFAAISGSSHDLETATSVPKCQVCHHPHTGQAVSTSRLWNINGGQDQPAGYSSGNATVDAASGFQSWACMSCHDGTFAVSTLYKPGTGNTAVTVPLTYGDLIEASPDTELDNDHPVAIVLTDNADYNIPSAGTVTLYPSNATGNKVECASCHDVHNGTAYTKMLKADNAGSAICLTCHVK